ncbi:type VI-B CRISPR-associated RNA-guided ribonuclease Cas13b [Myroides indicus]|uniref:Uncharacterized protein n=1 Tax=Myroides indicus TaxID=1323422 RepID=A0A4R7ESN1_9FLAO|nr:type VI-B CRISPR-associated RNA-guided ribonuclease Cas13b [Myroides indicus]TDS56528.1 hypothetical protein C8P70_12021 [Myroides indicus]
MENQASREKTNYNLNETPWYFGAYLNMARHNMFVLINHLTEKFKYLGFNKIDDDCEIIKDNILTSIFNPNNSNYEAERFKVYKYLVKRHYLPFVKIFHEKNGVQLDSNPIVDYHRLNQFINISFTHINKFRNSYTHYLAVDNDKNIIKERKKAIDNLIVEDLKKLFKHAPDFALQRFKDSQEENNFNHLDLYSILENNKLTEHGFYFFTNLFLNQTYAIQFLKKISGFKNETIPAFKATLQTFTAYAVKTPDIRLDNDDRNQSLLLEMMNELQKCPNELYRYLSEEDQKKFQPTLDTNSKTNFILNSIDYNAIHDDDIDSLLSETTSLRRSTNRFPYFALRFLEENNFLNNIRFQINIGKLHVRSYPKTIAHEKINRRIQKQIKGFGKLSDFENKEAEVLEKLNFNNDNCYFDQYSPHYNIVNNKIGFFLFESGEKTVIQKEQKLVKPTGFISIHDLPKIVMLSILKPNEVENTIKRFIDINTSDILNISKLDAIKSNLTLTPVAFTKRREKLKSITTENGYEFLNNDIERKIFSENKLNHDSILTYENKKINKKDKEHISQIKYKLLLKNRKQNLQKALTQKILVDQLPQKVVDYLLNLESIAEKKLIHAKIKSIKDEAKSKLRWIKKEVELPKEDQKIKLGEIATFIARDILNMIISLEVKEKFTSAYYNKLQNKIAYFSGSKKEIIAMCKELQLFNKIIGHVFLTKDQIEQSKGIIDFYQTYLESKISWIDQKLFRKGKEGGYIIPDNTNVPFTISSFKTNIAAQDFNNWLANKKKLPINLPTSLFDKNLCESLCKKLKTNKIDYKETDKFSILFAKSLKNDKQPFYDFKRVYECSQTGESVLVNTQNIHGKAIKSKYGKRAEENEKIIRFILTQDRVVKRMCEFILAQNTTENLQLDLSSFIPLSNQTPLNSAFSFKHVINLEKGKMLTIIAEDNEHQRSEVEEFNKLTSVEDQQKYSKQKGYQWTMKDFGRFKRFVSDKRIFNLLSFLETDTVTFDFITYQFREYDKIRSAVFQQTFELEEYIATNDLENLINEEFKRRRDFEEVQFKVYLKVLENKTDSNTIEILQNIRNKFSHSEFPILDEKETIKKITSKQIDTFEKEKHRKGGVESLDLSISTKYLALYTEKINSIIK